MGDRHLCIVVVVSVGCRREAVRRGHRFPLCWFACIWCLLLFPCGASFLVMRAYVCRYIVQLGLLILCMLEFCFSLYAGHGTIHMLLSIICRLAAAMLLLCCWWAAAMLLLCCCRAAAMLMVWCCYAAAMLPLCCCRSGVVVTLSIICLLVLVCFIVLCPVVSKLL